MNPRVVVFVRGVDEDDSSDFAPIEPVKRPSMKPAHRMAHQYVGRPDMGRVQQFMEIRCSGGTRLRARRAVAPANASAVVPTRTRNARNFRLNKDPAVARQAAAGNQYDRGPPFARTVNVEGPPPDVDGTANLWETLSIVPRFYLLIKGTRKREDQQCYESSRCVFVHSARVGV